jgi:hypothetical protein
MKMHISISVLAESSGAIGHVDGNLDFPVEPMVGDTISLSISDNDVPLDTSLGFDGLLLVEYRTIMPNIKKGAVSLMLQDLQVSDKESALKIMNYLQNEFGLNAHTY